MFLTDGLNSIKYHIKEIQKKNTFTQMLVDLTPKQVCTWFLSSEFHLQQFLFFFFRLASNQMHELKSHEINATGYKAP